MSVENFQVERVGNTLTIWVDSGANVEKNMLAFTHEFESEIEADLVRQKIDEFTENDRLECCDLGIISAQRSLSKQAERAVNELINKAQF